jgi:glycosyltransferase involved in cell wall biosynthesis
VKKIMMMGPMPPAIGGMATVLDNLSKSAFVNLCDVIFWNTAKESSVGRSLFSAIKSRFAIWTKFYKTLKKEQPDFVHIHTCSGFITFFLDASFALISRWCGIPYFVHIHGGKYEEFLNGLSKIKLKFVLSVLKKANNVIALTPEWQVIFEKNWQMTNVKVLFNGVPNSHYERMECSGAPHILYMGQIHSDKGVKDLIKAFALADSNEAVLHLAGDFGGDITQGEIEAYIEQFPSVTKKIIVEGPVVGERKITLMQNCDIFCLPSYAEGLPMVVLEAMSYKQTVLTTNVGGLPGLIHHERNGLLTEPGDIEAISQGITMLIKDKESRLQIAQQGYKTFIEKYSIDTIVQDYVQLYND